MTRRGQDRGSRVEETGVSLSRGAEDFHSVGPQNKQTKKVKLREGRGEAGGGIGDGLDQMHYVHI